MLKEKQWIEGQLDWFDSLSGTGFIRGNDNQLYFVHESAFDSRPKKLKKNSKVKFKVYEDISTRQVERVRTA